MTLSLWPLPFSWPSSVKLVKPSCHMPVLCTLSNQKMPLGLSQPTNYPSSSWRTLQHAVTVFQVLDRGSTWSSWWCSLSRSQQCLDPALNLQDTPPSPHLLSITVLVLQDPHRTCCRYHAFKVPGRFIKSMKKASSKSFSVNALPFEQPTQRMIRVSSISRKLKLPVSSMFNIKQILSPMFNIRPVNTSHDNLPDLQI